MTGLGFGRDVLEEAGIKEADAFVAVSSGDNSNIVSARVALEHYHVPKVIARIYDPRRAEIYQRLNIPTVATTTWGIKQMELMLLHDRQEVRESLGGGDLLRVRVPVPATPDGQEGCPPRQRRGQDPGRWRLPRRRQGSLSYGRQHLPEGDYLAVIMAKDGMDLLGETAARADRRTPLMKCRRHGSGAVRRPSLASDLADRGHEDSSIRTPASS